MSITTPLLHWGSLFLLKKKFLGFLKVCTNFKTQQLKYARVYKYVRVENMYKITIVAKNIQTIRSGPLYLDLASTLCGGGGGGHLPELVGGVVHVPLLLGLDLPLVHPGGGHLPELDHGGRGQQCWTDWAWVCIAGWCYHWIGAACGETSPRQAPCPDKYWLDVCHT